MPRTTNHSYLYSGLQRGHLLSERPQRPVQSSRLIDTLNLPGVSPAETTLGIVAVVIETAPDDVLLNPVKHRPQVIPNVASAANMEHLLRLHVRCLVIILVHRESDSVGSFSQEHLLGSSQLQLAPLVRCVESALCVVDDRENTLDHLGCH